MRSALAATILLMAMGLIAGLVGAAWMAMRDLPGREAMQMASAEASLTDPVARIEADRARRERAALAQTARDEAGVRYVEESGIIATRVSGELERLSPIVDVAEPVDAEPERETHRLVVIESAGMINVRSHRIALAHVAAPAVDEKCTNTAGVDWPCGRRARTALRRLVRRREIGCLPVSIIETEIESIEVARCEVDGTDLSKWLVEQGWAKPAETAPPEFRTAHLSAQNLGLGLYQKSAR